MTFVRYFLVFLPAVLASITREDYTDKVFVLSEPDAAPPASAPTRKRHLRREEYNDVPGGVWDWLVTSFNKEATTLSPPDEQATNLPAARDKVAEPIEQNQVDMLQEEAKQSELAVRKAIADLQHSLHDVADAMHSSPCAFSRRGCET
mmetsp:Transcript_24020/g.58324  ORF Transcript_24020/g.58324 Transcript_24020/m.58324 type:complete len:148 (-) Transcript_24020:118-561(-)